LPGFRETFEKPHDRGSRKKKKKGMTPPQKRALLDKASPWGSTAHRQQNGGVPLMKKPSPRTLFGKTTKEIMTVAKASPEMLHCKQGRAGNFSAKGY